MNKELQEFLDNGGIIKKIPYMPPEEVNPVVPTVNTNSQYSLSDAPHFLSNNIDKKKKYIRKKYKNHSIKIDLLPEELKDYVKQ